MACNIRAHLIDEINTIYINIISKFSVLKSRIWVDQCKKPLPSAISIFSDQTYVMYLMVLNHLIIVVNVVNSLSGNFLPLTTKIRLPE